MQQQDARLGCCKKMDADIDVLVAAREERTVVGTVVREALVGLARPGGSERFGHEAATASAEAAALGTPAGAAGFSMQYSGRA